MTRWKARVEFLWSVIELLFLSLTVEALQGKMCQNSLPSGGCRSLGAKISGEGVAPGEYFLIFTKVDTFCYLTVQTAPCYVPSFWHNTGVWQTDRRKDGQTDGIAVASTALAMRALRLTVKTFYCRWYSLQGNTVITVLVVFVIEQLYADWDMYWQWRRRFVCVLISTHCVVANRHSVSWLHAWH